MIVALQIETDQRGLGRKAAAVIDDNDTSNRPRGSSLRVNDFRWIAREESLCGIAPSHAARTMMTPILGSVRKQDGGMVPSASRPHAALPRLERYNEHPAVETQLHRGQRDDIHMRGIARSSCQQRLLVWMDGDCSCFPGAVPGKGTYRLEYAVRCMKAERCRSGNAGRRWGYRRVAVNQRRAGWATDVYFSWC